MALSPGLGCVLHAYAHNGSGSTWAWMDDAATATYAAPTTHKDEAHMLFHRDLRDESG